MCTDWSRGLEIHTTSLLFTVFTLLMSIVASIIYLASGWLGGWPVIDS